MPVKYEGLHVNKVEVRSQIDTERNIALELLKSYNIETGELADFLNKVDFGFMKELFYGDFVKSGGGGQEMVFLNRDSFVITNTEGYKQLGAPENDVMTYVPQAGIVLINEEQLEKGLKENPKIDRFTLFLQVLFHEQGHAVSSNTITDRIAQVGLQHIELGNDRVQSVSFNLFNEGLNELRARQLTSIYLKSKGENLTGPSTEWLENIFASAIPQASFLFAVNLIHEMCLRIAEVQNVEYQAVLNSLLHSTFNGLSLVDKESKKELDLDGVFGKGFLAKLQKLNQGDMTETLDFMKEFRLVKNGRAFMMALTNKLGIRMG